MRPPVQTAIARTVEGFARTLEPGSSVVDVGCGRRPYETCFEHCEYVGVDVEESGREAHEKRADVYFDGENIPFPADHFDAAICNEVLEHAVNPEALVRDVQRVLRPGGLLLLTVPFIWGEHELPFDFRRYSRFGVTRLVEESGLVVEDIQRLNAGVDALAHLVASEMNASEESRGRTGGLRRFVTAPAVRAWRLQLRLWRRLYDFDRIYLDTAVVARKPPNATG